MSPYFVDLKDLGRDKISVQGAFQPNEIDFSADNLREVRSLEWSATVERSGAEVRVAGSLVTAVELTCSRCLEPARHQISKSFDLYFRQRDEFMFDEDEEIELKELETRTAFFTGTQLNIGDILHEQILLALPMKALCKQDCKGLCSTCGANLNVSTCGCRKQPFSPHLDALFEIKRRMED